MRGRIPSELKQKEGVSGLEVSGFRGLENSPVIVANDESVIGDREFGKYR